MVVHVEPVSQRGEELAGACGHDVERAVGYGLHGDHGPVALSGDVGDFRAVAGGAQIVDSLRARDVEDRFVARLASGGGFAGGIGRVDDLRDVVPFRPLADDGFGAEGAGMHEHEIREDVPVAFQEAGDALFVERGALGRDEDARSDRKQRRVRDGLGSKREALRRFVDPFC